jgi:hypothetical protein
MKKEADETAELMGNLPPVAPKVAQQIKDASQVSAATAIKGIQESGSYARAPLKFPVSQV